MTTPSLSNPLFAGLLIHTAKVYRRQQVNALPTDLPEHVDHWGKKDKVDSFKQPTRDEAYSHDLACRFSTPKGSTRFEERSRDVVEVRGKLFLDQGADLRETDVVTILGAEGNVKVERALVDEVENVDDGVGNHHIEATLVSQRGAR